MPHALHDGGLPLRVGHPLSGDDEDAAANNQDAQCRGERLPTDRQEADEDEQDGESAPAERLGRFVSGRGGVCH